MISFGYKLYKCQNPIQTAIFTPGEKSEKCAVDSLYRLRNRTRKKLTSSNTRMNYSVGIVAK